MLINELWGNGPASEGLESHTDFEPDFSDPNKSNNPWGVKLPRTSLTISVDRPLVAGFARSWKGSVLL